MEFVEKLVNIARLRHLRNVAQDGLYRAHAVICVDDILLQLSIGHMLLSVWMISYCD